MKKFKIAGTVLAVLLVVMIAPLTVAAATNTELIAIMTEAITGHLANGAQVGADITQDIRDTYCAAGITAFCP